MNKISVIRENQSYFFAIKRITVNKNIVLKSLLTVNTDCPVGF